ncbi:MAG: hypothetical protein K2X27_26690 [Candidatus Obscuribacterales bacterium]|nr:hypothetical protein [Candidatus Obscuribacterales bacterium]
MGNMVFKGQHKQKLNGLSALLNAACLLSIPTAAMAQGMEAGSWQTMSPSSAIGPEQDSLLPPEVVPFDPATAANYSASQAQSREAAMNVPGLAPQSNPKDMRQQALGQLYGNQNSLPPAAMNQIWRAGQQAQQAQFPQFPPQGNAQGAVPGMVPPQAQAGAPNYQMANNQEMQQGYIAQSQTLTGGSQNQPQQVNTKRGGISNMLNYASAFGAGALTSGFWSNNPWMGAGIFGMTMTGMGVRNNSRF